jgi:hypothetical protein
MEESKRAHIQSVLADFERRSFPMGIRSIQIESKNVSILQSEVLGAMHTILEMDGQLGTRVKADFERNIQLLTVAINQLEAEAAAYFTDLLAIARMGEVVVRPLEF